MVVGLTTFVGKSARNKFEALSCVPLIRAKKQNLSFLGTD